MAHTPGPWRVSGEETIYGNLGWVASVSRFNREDNARLVAAAPDMLAALKEAQELAKLAATLTGCRGDDDYVWGIQAKIDAAISKAEGKL